LCAQRWDFGIRGQTLGLWERVSATLGLWDRPPKSLRLSLMDVLYIRRSLAWIHAIVFGHVSEFQHIRVKTNLEAARMCISSYTMHLIAGI
jgi:hypothetical protein